MIAIGNEMRVRKAKEVEASKETPILPDFLTPLATSPHPLKHQTNSPHPSLIA
jgi:hypothetical protein